VADDADQFRLEGIQFAQAPVGLLEQQVPLLQLALHPPRPGDVPGDDQGDAVLSTQARGGDLHYEGPGPLGLREG
jgi:hypothetical protein